MTANLWTCDPRYSTNCRTLYGILVSYADTGTRDTGRVKPYRAELARQLGCSVSTLDRTLFEGEVAGLWTVEARTVAGASAYNDANVYHLHDAGVMYAGGSWTDPLPAGVKAADVAKARVQERRAVKREQGEMPKGGVPKGVNSRALKARRAAAQDAVEWPCGPTCSVMGGGISAARGSSMGAARVAARVMPVFYIPVHNPSTELAPMARSANDARRASAGSSARGTASGCAATTENGPVVAAAGGRAAGQGQGAGSPFSGEELAAIYAVQAALPREVRQGLPYGHIPNRNRPAVLAALESRSVEEIAERIARRWVSFGYEPAFYHEGLNSPVGVALELLAPSRYCPDARCEDETLMGTNVECPACSERRARRRAARKAGLEVPEPHPFRPGPVRAECIDCQRPVFGDVLCGRCREQEGPAAAAFAALLGPAIEEEQPLTEPEPEPAGDVPPAATPGAWPAAATEARRAQERAEAVAATVDDHLNITTVPIEDHPLGEGLRRADHTRGLHQAGAPEPGAFAPREQFLAPNAGQSISAARAAIAAGRARAGAEQG
ncbi:hypothetical protein ACFY0G_02080 [Streptomyces sp. NPDC001552]|uniref:hypothetical protein n=1 Tax=Streptomyces sp. NPDC001552 TaxID=3364587 RepID=UPI0036971617